MSPFAVCLYVLGALLALISVALDAFAAHGLVTVAPAAEQAVAWFGQATNFQMNHALGLIFATLMSEHAVVPRAKTVLRAAAVALAIGAVLFPAALYSLSFTGPAFFAPYGGYAVMIGWLLLAAGAVMSRPRTAQT